MQHNEEPRLVESSLVAWREVEELNPAGVSIRVAVNKATPVDFETRPDFDPLVSLCDNPLSALETVAKRGEFLAGGASKRPFFASEMAMMIRVAREWRERFEEAKKKASDPST